MTLIPEWMSNVHPLIVHFPVALLVIAVLADFLSLILKRYGWIRPAALWLYVFGALGAITAYITGKQAADIVNFPAPSYPAISRHADLALYTMLFFSIYALIRLIVVWRKWDNRNIIAIILFFVAASGLGLLQQTAEHGGELVFRYGVGTNIQQATNAQEQPAQATADLKIPVSENGSWMWQANSKAAQSLKSNFHFLKGNRDNLKLQTVKSENTGEALVLQTEKDKPYLLTYGPLLKNVQITARVNTDDFNGRFLLIHHAVNPNTYDFLALDRGEVRLGRVQNGTLKIFDQAKVAANGWLTLKVVSSSGHFRGYVNDKLIVHGHGSDLPAGQAGFAIAGTGKLQLSEIAVTSLDEETPMMNMGNQTMTHGSQESGHTH